MTAPGASESSPVIAMTGVAVGHLQDLDDHVLEDVNWSVAPGDYWVVAGMHDCGKTELMSMTAGLMPPQAGSYQLFGQEMPIYDEELVAERLRLGLVLEDGGLFHHLTVAENIALPLLYHRDLKGGEISDRVHALLESAELSPLADTMPASLGRSWRKRVGLVRALALEPEILLLDNPLAGLDLRDLRWWLQQLGELSDGTGALARDRRVTLIATTADLRPWRNRAGRFAILQNRRFVILGRRDELTGHAEPLVNELLAEGTHSI